MQSIVYHQHKVLHEKNGYFAAGEYTHTLRLTSELVDLRVGYANPVLKAQGAFNTRLDMGFRAKK